MPDYSEYIIKENNEINIFANYRGNETFMADIFLGPRLIKAFIYRQTELKDSIGENAMSTIILDYDKKALLIEMSPSEDPDGSGIFMIEYFVKLLEIRYPKWKINSAHSGIFDRQEYVSSNKEFSTLIDYGKVGWDEPRGTLISVNNGSIQSIYWNELSLYEIIPRGKMYVLDSRNHQRIPQGRFPFGGIHFNVNTQNMRFWYFYSTPFVIDWAKQQWQDCHVSFDYNNYQAHFELLRQPVFSALVNKAKKQVIERLKETIIFTYTNLANFGAVEDRFTKELEIHSVLERQHFFETALSEFDL